MAVHRDVDEARKAYDKKDVKAMIAAHSKSVYEKHQTEGKYLKSIIYGGIDGIITMFSVIAGVTGANLAIGIVLILGFANLIGDGLSMGIGDYLSSKSEIEYQRRERARETWEVEHYPAGERQELIDIYIHKGLDKVESETLVDCLGKNRKIFLDTMMVEELGILESLGSPRAKALTTFGAFNLFGFLPVISYILDHVITPLAHDPFLNFVVACVVTGCTLFILGTAKAKFTGKSWVRSGAELLGMGGIAAAAAYLLGFLLTNIILG